MNRFLPRTGFFLLLLLVIFPVGLMAKEKLVVADLEAGQGVDATLAVTLADFLRDELQALGDYEILSQRDLLAVAKRAALQGSAAADLASDSALGIGETLAARHLVTGSLAKLGDTYLVSLRLLDGTGENPGVLKRINESCTCSEGELLGVIRKMAAALMGRAAVAPEEKAVFLMGAEGQDAAMALEMVKVPGGCFQMGDNQSAGDPDELPVHEVCLEGFRIGRYEVTQALWLSVMGRNPAKFSRGGNYPVENVSWDEVQAFLDKLNQRTGLVYRLPSEAEWEFACRSGGQGEKFCGGDNPDIVAWYGSNSGRASHPVGGKAANGLGIYDMSGNVAEWVQDWYQEEYYRQSPKQAPGGPAIGSKRICRGGAWHDITRSVRATERAGFAPAGRASGLGFRLVLSGQ